MLVGEVLQWKQRHCQFLDPGPDPGPVRFGLLAPALTLSRQAGRLHCSKSWRHWQARLPHLRQSPPGHYNQADTQFRLHPPNHISRSSEVASCNWQHVHVWRLQCQHPKYDRVNETTRIANIEAGPGPGKTRSCSRDGSCFAKTPGDRRDRGRHIQTRR